MQIPRRSKDADRFVAAEFSKCYALIDALKVEVAILRALVTAVRPRAALGVTMRVVLTRLAPVVFNPPDTLLGLTVSAKLTLLQPVKVNPPDMAVGITLTAKVTRV